MFNLIGNCCTTAFIYKQMNVQFNNPFMWAAIWANDFIKLIQSFDEIDFKNPELEKYVLNDKELCYSIILNKNIKINYTHYKQGNQNDHHRIVGPDMYDWRAYEYTFNIFNERTNRMLNDNIKPCFVILGEMKNVPGYNLNFDSYNLENLIKICEIPTKHKICIITGHEELLKYQSERIKIIIDKHPKNERGFWTDTFASMYKNEIIKFAEN